MTARRTGIISVAALAALTLTVGVVHAVAPDWSRRMGFDVWNVPGLEEELAAADRDRDRLAVVDGTLMHRIAAKEATVAELIAGRTTLADVTAFFLSLNAERPDMLAILRATYPDGTDEHRTAMNVIDYVAQRVADADERDVIVCRLTAELAEAVSSGDTH